MKELDLYKFLQTYSVEMRWDDDELSAWIPGYCLAEFTTLIDNILHEGGLEARLTTGGYVWVDLVRICEHFDIDPARIFEGI